MKKFLLVLGMVTCLLGVTACGNENTVADADFSAAEAESIANYYIQNIGTLAGVMQADPVTYENQIYSIKDQDEEFGKAVDEAVNNFATALEDLGSCSSVESVEYTVDDEVVDIKATVVGTEINPKGEVRTAEVLLTVGKRSADLKSMLTNVNYTFGEMMTTAGLNTVLGICTVFMVLIILMAIISCFKIINNIEKSIADKKAGKTEKKADSVDNAVAQITANEEAQDDTELIAVIAAAIAASEGAASADGYVVRSIRRRY